jgi:acetylornithine aminotransferase
MEELSKIDGIINVRGRGLMVGFEMTEDLKDLKKQLLFDKKVFTGEAKPNVIRLLPSLAITKEQIDVFLQTVRELAAIK